MPELLNLLDTDSYTKKMFLSICISDTHIWSNQKEFYHFCIRNSISMDIYYIFNIHGYIPHIQYPWIYITYIYFKCLSFQRFSHAIWNTRTVDSFFFFVLVLTFPKECFIMIGIGPFPFFHLFLFLSFFLRTDRPYII